MTSGIILIFAVPMIVAAALISPSALHNLTHGLLFYAIVGLGLPIVGWQGWAACWGTADELGQVQDRRCPKRTVTEF
jgi:hypothetical protein